MEGWGNFQFRVSKKTKVVDIVYEETGQVFPWLSYVLHTKLIV